MKNSAVHDFILASQDNLRIAATVGDAWPEAREKLILGFLERLNSRLMKSLKGWVSELDGDFQQKYAASSFWKPGWDEYWISLESQEFGEQMVFGVMRDKDSIGKRPFIDELFNAIPQTGSRKAWWEVIIKMRSPAADWRKPEVLWRMHTDDNFLEDVAEQLLGVAKISEPIIDRWCKQYRASPVTK